MSTTMTIQNPSQKHPCGCSGGADGHPCTCGGAGCSSCQGQEFVRPRFFAGQLLTEDDLQTLTDYVAGKNRLHNRFLFGSGVVCGLKVKPNPCDCAQVVVEPGYALDCCGNDIIVACSQTLDINKMVRELKLKLLKGYDCGDPCAKAAPTTSASANSKSSATGAQAEGASGNKSAAVSPDTARKYCLYLDYCEQLTDPVSPYGGGSSCGGATLCEPARVHEGFKFELRCPPKEDCEPCICEALNQCGETDAEKGVASSIGLLRQFASTSLAALRQINLGVSPRLSIQELQESVRALEKTLSVEVTTESHAKALAIRLRNAAVAYAPVLHHKFEWKQSLKESLKELYIQEIHDKLEQAKRILHRNRGKLTDELWSSFAGALDSTVDELPDLVKKRIGTLDLEETPAHLPGILLLMHGAVVTPPYLSNCLKATRKLSAWLDERLEQAGQLPASRRMQKKLPVTVSVISEPLNYVELSAVAEEALRVLNDTETFQKDCECNALLPPCCPCTDTSVLIACITVQDCCVKEICNLDRKFVLSPTAIRYWSPEIQELGRSIEEYCCPTQCEGEVPGGDYELLCHEKDPSLLELMGYSPRLGEAIIWELKRLCEPIKPQRPAKPVDYRARGALGAILSHLASPVTTVPLRETEGPLRSALAELEKMKAEIAKLVDSVKKIERDRRAPRGEG